MAITLSAAILPIGAKILMQHAIVMYQVFIVSWIYGYYWHFKMNIIANRQFET